MRSNLATFFVKLLQFFGRMRMQTEVVGDDVSVVKVGKILHRTNSFLQTDDQSGSSALYTAWLSRPVSEQNVRLAELVVHCVSLRILIFFTTKF